MSDEEPQRRKEEGGDDLAWMSTFSDLLMLMLTFFVLLLTMSSMDAQKVNKIVRPGLQMQQGPARQASIMTTPAIPRIMPRRIIDIHSQMAIAPIGEVAQQFADVSEQILSAYTLEGRGWITRRPDGLDVHIDGEVAFEPGEATLTDASKKMLKEFVALTRAPGIILELETHVASEGDIWSRDESRQLALVRADVVARFFLARDFPPEGLRIMGYGHAAGTQEGRFLRQPELLSLKITLPREDRVKTSPERADDE